MFLPAWFNQILCTRKAVWGGVGGSNVDASKCDLPRLLNPSNEFTWRCLTISLFCTEPCPRINHPTKHCHGYCTIHHLMMRLKGKTTANATTSRPCWALQSAQVLNGLSCSPFSFPSAPPSPFIYSLKIFFSWKANSSTISQYLSTSRCSNSSPWPSSRLAPSLLHSQTTQPAPSLPEPTNPPIQSANNSQVATCMPTADLSTYQRRSRRRKPSWMLIQIQKPTLFEISSIPCPSSHWPRHPTGRQNPRLYQYRNRRSRIPRR